MSLNFEVETLDITEEEVGLVEEKLRNIEVENGQQSHQVQAIVAMQTIKHSQYTIDMIADEFDLRRNSVVDGLDVALEVGDVSKVGKANTGGRRADVYSYIDSSPASYNQSSIE